MLSQQERITQQGCFPIKCSRTTKISYWQQVCDEMRCSFQDIAAQMKWWCMVKHAKHVRSWPVLFKVLFFLYGE